MSTSDPSQVDTPTLIKSMRRDIGEAQKLVREAFKWLGEAQTTLWELERRNEAAHD